MAEKVTHKLKISAGDTEHYRIDCTDYLDGSELLTGTPTVAEVGTTDLTITNAAVSTGPLTILDRSVVTGAAIQFTVAGAVAGVTYLLRITSATDAASPRTLVRDADLECAA